MANVLPGCISPYLATERRTERAISMIVSRVTTAIIISFTATCLWAPSTPAAVAMPACYALSPLSDEAASTAARAPVRLFT